MLKTKNGRFNLSSECVLRGSKKINIYERQEPGRLLSSLRIRTPLNQIPLLGKLIF